jgi:hypothetical protein
MAEAVQEGLYRCLTREEIGGAVASFRKRLG